MRDLPLSCSDKTALYVAIEAADRAGESLRTNFQKASSVRHKGRANIVTDADLQAENSVKSLLQAEYPDHSILSEESEPVTGESEYTWILDPLDGTNNFSFGIPFFSTVLALASGSEVLLGIVYDPLRGELFLAQKGKGASLNNKRVSVSGKTAVRNSLIGLDLGYVDEKGKRLLQFITGLWPDVYAFRIMGSGALGMAYAASGRLDLYFHLLLYPWELACGQLLVSEAGGVATNLEGKPLGMGEDAVIASNEALHAEFLKLAQTKAL